MKIFICGLSRSGTTLLASIIGAHPDICILNEPLTQDYLKVVGKKHIGLKITLGNNITMKRIKTFHWFLFDILNRFINPFRKIHLRFLPISDYTINQLVKEADKLIVIDRKKTDVISSNMNRAGMPKKIALYRFRKGLKQRQWILNRFAAPFYQVQYETLIDNPVQEINKICDYLNVKYNEEMIINAKLNPYGMELKTKLK